MSMKKLDDVYKKILKAIEYRLDSNETTTNFQLNEIGKELFSDLFLGVFMSDTVPRMRKDNTCCIINVDKSNQLGSHWLGLYYRGGKYFYYDSFGRRPSKILDKKSIQSITGSGEILFDTIDGEQFDEETNCGQRAMAFLVICNIFGPEIGIQI